MSRCAIAERASLTCAFASANFLPPFTPRAGAASSPATVGSRISSRSTSASAAKCLPNTRRPAPVRGVELRALAGGHPQTHAAGRQSYTGVDRLGKVPAEAVELPDDEHFLHRTRGRGRR